MSVVLKQLYGGKIFCDHFSAVLADDECLVPGNTVNIQYKSALLGTAEILEIRKFSKNLCSSFLVAMDEGETSVKNYLRKLSTYGISGENLVHVVFKYKEKKYEEMESFMAEWWQSQKVNYVNEEL